MYMIPEPSKYFIEELKARMRADEIQNFGDDELNRVFDYVIQSDKCLRVIEFLVNNENFTIDELYNADTKYKKYCISYNDKITLNKINIYLYTSKNKNKVLQNAKKQYGSKCSVTII